MISLAHALLKAVMASNFDVKERQAVFQNMDLDPELLYCVILNQLRNNSTGSKSKFGQEV